MQTFLPFASFTKSMQCLDTKRLGNQRLEAKQLVNVLTDPSKRGTGWANHPAAKMWSGRVEALKHYHNVAILTWIERGYKNTMELYLVKHDMIEMPDWIGSADFHNPHQSNLLRKDFAHYEKHFGPGPTDLEYVWPTSGFDVGVAPTRIISA